MYVYTYRVVWLQQLFRFTRSMIVLLHNFLYYFNMLALALQVFRLSQGYSIYRHTYKNHNDLNCYQSIFYGQKGKVLELLATLNATILTLSYIYYIVYVSIYSIVGFKFQLYMYIFIYVQTTNYRIHCIVLIVYGKFNIRIVQFLSMSLAYARVDR